MDYAGSSDIDHRKVTTLRLQEMKQNGQKISFKQHHVDAFNERLKQLTQEKGILYLDLASPLKDEAGFLNRIVEPAALMPTAMDMARHLLSLPPASRVNTTVMMRAMRPQVGAEFERLAARLHEHGATSDRLESRRAFAEKRAPEWKGWNDPEDRFRTPKLDDGKNG